MSNISQAASRDVTDPLLELNDVKTHFRTARGLVRAVDGVTFSLDRGKALGIVGESGSGKTILSRSIMGLLPPRGPSGQAASSSKDARSATSIASRCAACGARKWR